MEYMDKLLIPILSAAVAFIGSWAVAKYRIDEMAKKIFALEKQRENDRKDCDQKFKEADWERERQRDLLINKIHDMDKKVTEIYTIIKNNKS